MTGDRQKYRVYLADSDKDFLKYAVAALQECKELELVGWSDDGEKAFAQITELKPHLAVVDVMLPTIGGLVLADRLRKIGKSISIIMLSIFSGHHLGVECEMLEVDALVRKPVPPEYLRERILLWARGKDCGDERTQTRRLRRILFDVTRELGLHMQGKADECLCEALSTAVRQGDDSIRMTKALYPAVARRLHTTPENVERMLRSAIEHVWAHCDRKTLCVYFGAQVGQKETRPTNGAFINDLVRYVHEQNRRILDGE